MILNELAKMAPKKQITRIFEQYFGKSINVDSITNGQARSMLVKVRRTLEEHRTSPAFHRSEKNASYLKLVMMEQALVTHIKEGIAGVGDARDTDVAGIGERTPMGSRGSDPEVVAVAKAKREEQKKQQMTESLRRIQRHLGRRLTESEIQQAQVVLASQDIVDSIQKMIEDMTEVQFKELPALVDSIKNQVGTAEADTFNQAATAALGGLVQNLQGAKQQLEAAQATLTGQQPVVGAGAPGAELGAPGMPPPEGAEELGGLPPPSGAEDDLFGEPTDLAEPPSKPKAGLGRSRR